MSHLCPESMQGSTRRRAQGPLQLVISYKNTQSPRMSLLGPGRVAEGLGREQAWPVASGQHAKSEGGNPALPAWPLQFPGWWSSCGINICDGGPLRNESACTGLLCPSLSLATDG